VGLKWSDLDPIWQACLEEAWQAFQHCSVPIGAIITDANGMIISRGRNHIYDDSQLPGQVSRNQLAHAELNALLHFDRNEHDHHSCSIYTSMEPCPLCMGAIYMMGIRQVHYASRDAYAGSTNMLGATPYLSRKEIRAYSPPYPELENALIALLVLFSLKRPNPPFSARTGEVIEAWQETCPVGVTLGKQLSEARSLSTLTSGNMQVDEGFNFLFAELQVLGAGKKGQL